MILEKQPILMNDAKKLALTSPYGRFKVGAVFARRRHVISMGVNQQKTHPLQAKFTARPDLQSWLHAEISGIAMAVVEELLGCDVYVARVTKDGNLANSRPCTGCQSALRHYGVARMFYYQEGEFHCEEVG